MTIQIENESTIARYILLFSVFDGDPNEWLSYLRSQGSPSQREHDLPFVQWLLAQKRNDSDFIEDLRLLLMGGDGQQH